MKKQSITALRFILIAMILFVGDTLIAGESSRTAVTVYNQDLALIRQIRSMDVVKGRQWYSYDGVAARIDPTSVHFKAEGINVLEQNFEYDLVDNQTLLRKYIGQTIEVRLAEGIIKGTLLADQQPLILQDFEGKVRTLNVDNVQSVDFPELPEGLVLKPTLRWDLFAEKRGNIEAELSYLTHGISWEASYVAVVSQQDDALDFSGWVQIDNRSGATYEDAKLKLMAGDVRIEEDLDGGRRRKKFTAMTGAEMDALAGFEEKTFFEYHLYTLPRVVTIRDRQKKQISLFPSASASAKKTFTYSAAQDDKKVQVTIEFINEEKNELGIPLPKGKVRLMKRDSDGSLEFIGEDRIDHTPKNEKVRLRTGSAFDIVAERTHTDSKSYKQDERKIRENAWEVEFRNSKDEAVEITVLERLYGNWEIIEENIKGRKKDAFTYEWIVKVPADGNTKLTYRIKNR